MQGARTDGPDEAAAVIACLASDNGAYVNGTAHPVDGGFTAVSWGSVGMEMGAGGEAVTVTVAGTYIRRCPL